jgi:DUF1365 family protein
MTASALYTGVVTHRRFRPREHALRYRIFMLLLDLDEIDSLIARLWALSAGRFGLLSFDPRDHGDGSATPLTAQVRAKLDAAGLMADGPIRLMCMPRILGHGFNPISAYFCHHADGTLAATLYEVHNTFGERHSYLIAAGAGPDGVVRQSADKRFHVSPFLDMDLRYAFELTPPGETVRLSILASQDGQPMLAAAFAGRRRDLSDGSLLAVWLTHPLLTLKVVAGIHWEALLIWTKGVAYRPKPAPPDMPVTVGSSTPFRLS